MNAARQELESLLRARKLDRTLTTAQPAPDDGVASTGWTPLDALLGGGLRRGHLSEIVGPRSAGSTTVFCRMAAAAAARGEVVALIDTHDRFDPASAARAGVDLGRLLWVREAGHADRALKATNLVLQAGGFGLVAFDLSDASPRAVRQFPHTTWMRLARILEGRPTVAVLLGAGHIARSPGGVTIALDPPAGGSAAWSGASARARRLSGLVIRPRVISGRAVCAFPPTTI